MTTPALHTARLRLAPYTPDDEEDFVALFQDTRVSRWMGEGPRSETEDRALFGRIFSRVYAQDLFDVWAVRHEGRFVGHAEIKPSADPGGHEIVYALAATAWGQGFGTEIAQALTGYGFDALGLTEVHATVAADNTASLTLLGGIGFRHVRDTVEEDGSTTRVLTRSAASGAAGTGQPR
ncbi:GNAT family N-acetyltransferase [Streptomyces sp. NPDC018352]|uniref:GNAT family N-acetyltransferase n=1 Tax=Streptomyces sp. NPDC018352 TaxID=3157194 RepID=UPI0033D0542F